MKRGVSRNSGILFAPRSRVSWTVHVCSKLKHPLLVAREILVSVALAIALTMIGGTAQPSACGLCPSQHNGRAGRHRIVIANEAARFWRVLGTKIVCSTE